MELVGQLSLGPSPACSVAGISVRVNDVWGYDSPSGTPLALVGLCDGTAIVDVTDPTNPTLLSTVPGPKSVWRDIKTFNQFAYIVHDILDASETNPAIGVQIVDLEDPTFPVVATLSDGFNRAHNLFIDTSRGHLYVANWKPASLLVAPGFLHPEEEHPAGGNGIRIYDLNASPTAPPFLGEWNQCNVHDLSVQGNVVYLACLRQGLWFVDVSDPTAPVTLDSFTYTQDTGGSPQTNYTHNVWPSGDGSFAVVTDEEKDQRVKFIEIPSFASPAVVSEYEALPAILAHNAFIRGDFTYISYYSEGVVVLESSDPSAVCELGYYDTYLLPVGPGATDGFRGAWGIYPYTASGLIYVSDISAGLYVLRFDPPSRAPIDLSLVLDVSGSMASTAIGGTTPKIEVLKDAVELFVEVWRPFTVPGDRLGIVYFESNVETAFIDGSISTPFCSYHKAFVTDVRGRFTGNLTALGGGLLTAVRSFEDTPKPRVVILVTDGMQNVSPMVVEAGIEAIFFDLGDTLVEDPGTGTWTLVPDAASAVAALKARGIRLGIITNVPSTWTRADLEARLESPEFLDEFEVIVLSSEAPAQKPDPAIYTHALSLLPNPPPVSHVAFVTETPEHIIGTNAMGEPVGAQAVGMVGILKAPGTSPDADHMVPNLTSIIPTRCYRCPKGLVCTRSQASPASQGRPSPTWALQFTQLASEPRRAAVGKSCLWIWPQKPEGCIILPAPRMPNCRTLSRTLWS
jgi:choice-of-anchor B domain-containing protein